MKMYYLAPSITYICIEESDSLMDTFSIVISNDEPVNNDDGPQYVRPNSVWDDEED